MITSIMLGTVVLFAVGAIGARFTNKSVIRNGIRQVVLGLIIVSISYRLGLKIGG
jgi:VIT1/CCC1 family predicted Fe2+/Mn2+ transporter